MLNKIRLTLIAFLFILSGCGSHQSNKIPDNNQSPANIRSKEDKPDVTFHQAALDGQKSDIIRLLSEGTDVNMMDVEGRTAIMYASYNGHTDIVKELLNRGAKVNLHDQYGRTALMFACRLVQETVKLLLQHKADPNIADNEKHFTALMYAAAEGQLEVVKLLLTNKADPGLKYIDGSMAVTFALNNGHKEVADFIRSFIKSKNDLKENGNILPK